MGAKNEKSLPNFLNKIKTQNKFDLNKFIQETPRKLNLHILSSVKKNCISFVEYLTSFKFPFASD